MKVISAFRLVAYAPVYLAATEDDLEVVTLDGISGADGPDRLRDGDADFLLGGPIRLLDDVRRGGTSDLRVIASVTNACPFYVVSGDGQHPVAPQQVYGFDASDAPGRCLQASTEFDVLPPDGLPQSVTERLAADPEAHFLVPGDVAIPLERSGDAHIQVSVPATMPGIVFSALESLTTRRPPPELIHRLRRRLDRQLRRCRFGPVADLVEDLSGWFPELATEDLRAVVLRYRADGVWPRTATPSEAAMVAYARGLDPGLATSSFDEVRGLIA
jgi:hypothetical protein